MRGRGARARADGPADAPTAPDDPQVVIGNDEPADMALKRFRREVMSAGLMQEVRRRRYFENSVGERWES
jgi:ribosomal protein S21